MASVYRKHDRYYARWKDATGRWQRTVTACRTRKDAQRFAEDLERKAERQARGLEAMPEDVPRGSSSAPPHVPLVSPRDQLGKTKGRDSLNNINEITAQKWSGRLDLNQRPLAPQLDLARSAGLALRVATW
jgi:hypothetical protein